MTASDHVLSVTELNRRARQLLEVHLANVWVRGEISNLATPSSGHWYFTLKDDKAQVRCAMFRGQNALLRFRPEHGMQVIARGRISLYEGRGDYQLIIENLQADGVGNLQIAFEQLKAKLADEGLFDEDFKQPLPEFPQHIGIITSPTGAVIQDMITIFRRRFPAIRISVFPVPVQGTEAAPAIVCAISLANTCDDIDALIIARGGGSLEDLWAFNEEAVARAVFSSEIPVVSAVGHETDVTICDFVADMRAPTPSAAAELLSPDRNDLEALLLHYAEELAKNIRRRLSAERVDLLGLVRRLRHPSHALREAQQRLDHLDWRLYRAQQLHNQQLQLALEKLEVRLQQHDPAQRLRLGSQRLTASYQRLRKASERHLLHSRQRLSHLSALLDSVSPLSTLKRGYAIATDESGATLTRASQAMPGDSVLLRLHKGRLSCEVRQQWLDEDP